MADAPTDGAKPVDPLLCLPYPIAAPLAVARDPSIDPLRRFEHVLFAFTQYLRMVGLPILVQYLNQPVIIPSINRAVAALRRPHVSDWATLLYTAIKHFPKHGIEPCFPELRAHLASASRRPLTLPGLTTDATPQHPIELLQEVRNRFWGHGAPSEPQGAADSGALLPAGAGVPALGVGLPARVAPVRAHRGRRPRPGLRCLLRCGRPWRRRAARRFGRRVGGACRRSHRGP